MTTATTASGGRCEANRCTGLVKGQCSRQIASATTTLRGRVARPGPPCGNGGVHDTDGAEGYVHIHAGIHGVGDLDPAELDWNNPVALVKVRRVARR